MEVVENKPRRKTPRNADPIKFVRPMALAQRLGIDHSTLWRWVDRGDFPPPLRLSPGVRGWREIEIKRWLKSRPTVEVGSHDEA